MDCWYNQRMAWQGEITEQGAGSVGLAPDRYRLELATTTQSGYSNAQVDDGQGRPRRKLPWRAPVSLGVRARFSHGATRLQGTAGFGFWNFPFGPGLGQLPALPRAAWFFFGSPPYNVPLAAGVPGYGWKAAALDATRPGALLWAPVSPGAVLMMRSKRVRQRLWPRIQRALGVAEVNLDIDMTMWHHYQLDWLPVKVAFRVDGELVLESRASPGSPMGFVAWIDNQYAIATPDGRFGWGLLATRERQWLELHVPTMNQTQSAGVEYGL